LVRHGFDWNIIATSNATTKIKYHPERYTVTALAFTDWISRLMNSTLYFALPV